MSKKGNISQIMGAVVDVSFPEGQLPEIYNADGFFDATSYIGAVNGSTDNWYKNWTLSGTIEVQ